MRIFDAGSAGLELFGEKGMKRRLLLGVCMALILGTGPKSASAAVHVVGNHAPPYRIVEGERFTGIYFDLMKELGKRMGVRMEFRNVPFKRGLHMMKSGAADIMPGLNRMAEREAYLVYTRAALSPARKAFYVAPGVEPIGRYEDLRGKTIAVHRGKVYFERFDNDPSLVKEETDDYLSGILKVRKKRNDVIIMPEMEGDYLLGKYRIRLLKSPYTAQGRLSYIAISRKSIALLLKDRIERAMKDMRSDGTLKAIERRYLSP